MSYGFGLRQTLDDYDITTTWDQGMLCARLTGFVSGAPIIYEIKDKDASNWSDEFFIPAAKGLTFFVSFDRNFVAFRCRSAVLATPAVVTFEFLTPADIPNA